MGQGQGQCGMITGWIQGKGLQGGPSPTVQTWTQSWGAQETGQFRILGLL